MRFSHRITFVAETDGGYDPETGKHIEPTITEDTRPCNLSELGTERTNELFGQIDKRIIVARLQRPYNEPFDYIKIGEQRYNIKRQSEYRKGVFYLEGAVHGN